MALDGGGGGGGPVGIANSFTGPSSALEIQGNHAYAYSGSIPTASLSVETTYLEFQTGNFYLVGSVNFNSLINSGSEIKYQVYLNDALINGYIQANSAASDQAEPDFGMPIIIPPYTNVKCTCTSGDDANLPQIATLTGRIYRS